MTVTTAHLQEAWGGISRKEAIRKATAAGAVATRAGRSMEWNLDSLPTDTQLALAGHAPATKPANQEIPQAFIGTPEKYRHVALLRSSLIARFRDMEAGGIKIEDFVAMFNAGAVCQAIFADPLIAN